MTHMIQGLIAPPWPAAKAAGVDGAVSLPLPSASLVFLPMTDTLLERLQMLFQGAVGEPYPEFEKLSNSAVLWIRDVSTAGRVAYIETEYFGGTGTQAAAVWEVGATIFGPQKADAGAINGALKLLGVERTAAKDEFDVVDLGRYRNNENWLNPPGTARRR